MTFDAAVTFEQVAIIGLLLLMMVVFAIDRFRIELVALTGLAVGFALGLVPEGNVFSGFSNAAVITVAEILLIIQALSRSRIVERLTGSVTRFVRGETSALAFLCVVSGFISVFMNNIGALALILPVAITLSTQLGLPVRRTLMPVSFATLLGGLCSLIGTPANLVISHTRESLLGQPFAFFDLAYVGVPVAVVGILFLILWAPRRLWLWRSGLSREQGIRQRKLVTEILLPPASPFLGGTASDLMAALDAQIFSVIRDGKRLFGQDRKHSLEAGDIVVLEVTTAVLEEACAAGSVQLMQPAGINDEDASTIDVVLMPQSIFVGSRVGLLEPLASRDISVTGVIPQRSRVEGRLADIQLGIGDVLVLRGSEEAINEVLDEVDMLRLSARESPAPRPGSYTAIIAFSIGVLFAAADIMPSEFAFGLVVLTLSASGSLRIREALHSLNWPILVMLAAMIPLGSAVEATGAARALSLGLLDILPSSEPIALVGCVLLVAVLLTPFVNNVSTAVVLGPVAFEIANAANLPPEPFLVAVALGASLDFLTPFGHHNNTVVMGVAGYRFIDFPPLGLPLLAVTFGVGLAAISFFWL